MELNRLFGWGVLVGVPLYFVLDPPEGRRKDIGEITSRYGSVFRSLAERAWRIANREMKEGIEATGLTWTGVAQLLDELSGKRKWGILETLTD